MNNLTKRAITGVIAGSLVVAAIVLHHFSFLLFCFLVSMLGLYEFFTMTKTRSKGVIFSAFAGSLSIWATICLNIFTDENYWMPFAGLALLSFPFMAIFSLFDKDDKQPLYTIGKGVLGIVYPFLPFVLFFMLGMRGWMNGTSGWNGPDYHFEIPMGILLMVWATDTFAYFGGRAMGKRKLFERISPKKTWEGAISGGIGAIALGTLFHFIWPVESWSWVSAGAIVAVFSQVGDLVESMMKRSLFVKDSGTILPGHGGILDRFDGPYVAIPILFLLQLFLVAWS